MAITVSNAFVTMFGDEVTHLAQQKASNLQGAVRIVRGVTGSTYKFPTLGKAGAIKNKTSHQDLEALSAVNPASVTSGTWIGATGDTMAHAVATATIDTYSTGEYIDDFDALKTNIDLRSSYAESIAASMNRAMDAEIISALDGTTATAGATTGDTLNEAKLQAIHQAMNEKDVPLTDRYIVCAPQGFNDLIASLGNTAAGPFSDALKTGVIEGAYGFNIIVNTGLSDGASSDFKSYAFHKNAVGLAVGKDITTMVNYVPQKLSTLVAAEFSAGAIMIDPSAVYSFQA